MLPILHCHIVESTKLTWIKSASMSTLCNIGKDEKKTLDTFFLCSFYTILFCIKYSRMSIKDIVVLEVKSSNK